MKALVTGGGGFVGHHLCRLLVTEGAEVDAFVHSDGATRPRETARVHVVDLTDPTGLREAIDRVRPTHVFHLAGVLGNAAPSLQLEVNVLGTQNLFEAVLSLDRRPWMLLGSSSAVYGSHPDPIDEGSPISPATFYAITKAAQELVALQDRFARDLTVAITRTFNLVGPGLQEKLLLGDAARQIVRIERGDVASLNLGNLDTRRDFLDVRDAARAYVLLAQAAGTGIYNVCSGTSYSVRESIGMLTRLAEVDIDVKVEKGRLRSSDVATQVGSHERLTEATGWEPRIPLEQSLADLLAECRREAHS